jgi:hypothetical protein
MPDYIDNSKQWSTYVCMYIYRESSKRRNKTNMAPEKSTQRPNTTLPQDIQSSIGTKSFLAEHHAMKAYWESGGIDLRILASARDGGEWSVSRSSRFTPRKSAPGTHWIGGWVGPRAGLDAVVKRKVPSPWRDSNPPIIQPVA